MIKISEVLAAAWLTDNGLTDASQVNSGLCEEFAKEFIKLFPSGEIVGTDNYIDFDSAEWPGGHIWIYSDGRHYDSETLSGVTEWRQLPFFKRKLG